MSRLLSLIVAGVFAISGGAALAASHTGGKMDDKKDEKKMEKKGEEKKMEKKGEEKKMEKKEEKKGEAKKP